MKNKNIYLIVAGLINGFTFLLHLFGGQVTLVDPMLETSLSLEITSQLVGAWHIVTIILLATSIILLLAGFSKKYIMSKDLLYFIGYLNLSFCLPFIIESFYYTILVPQWILFLPIGLLTILGIKKNVAM